MNLDVECFGQPRPCSCSAVLCRQAIGPATVRAVVRQAVRQIRKIRSVLSNPASILESDPELSRNFVSG
jgi:hypothetical protein